MKTEPTTEEEHIAAFVEASENLAASSHLKRVALSRVKAEIELIELLCIDAPQEHVQRRIELAEKAKLAIKEEGKAALVYEKARLAYRSFIVAKQAKSS